MNAKQDEGHTPLLLAARAGHLEIVKTLVEYGACIYSKGQRTPLGEAYQCGHQEVVDFLSSFSKKSGKSKLRQQTTNRGATQNLLQNPETVFIYSLCWQSFLNPAVFNATATDILVPPRICSCCHLLI